VGGGSGKTAATHAYNLPVSRARTRTRTNSMYRMSGLQQVHHNNTPAEKSAAHQTVADKRRIQVRKSGVHGKGVFALRPIAKGERVIEYKGQIVSWPEALRRHPHDPKDPNHTFYFHIDDKNVIDAKVGGNAARWINHACAPNCEADEVDGRIFIKALRRLLPGEELFYDYGLIIDVRYTEKLKREYECRCGARSCRRTMLAPKR
jgi:uncharacterized protein